MSLRKIKITVEAEATMPEHMVRRLENAIAAGPRDRKLLAIDIIQESSNPKIEVLENRRA